VKKYKLIGNKGETEVEVLKQINSQIKNVIDITRIELQYAKGENGKVKFLEYESK
jgi:hypothetical protein